MCQTGKYSALMVFFIHSFIHIKTVIHLFQERVQWLLREQYVSAHRPEAVKTFSPCLMSDTVNGLETVVGNITESHPFYYFIHTDTFVPLSTNDKTTNN